MTLPRYVDLHELEEDERIELIAETALCGHVVGVAIDDEDEKVLRYREKIEAKGVRIIDERPGIDGIRMIRVGPPANQ